MKNRILSILFLPLLFACSDWLNVTPEEDVEETDLYADGEGYRNALNGVYSYISGSDLYARELSWGFLDVVGGYYAAEMMNQYGPYPKALKGDYNNNDVKGVLEGIWQGAYKAIANCNNMLVNLEKEGPEKFLGREEEKNMLKGEALALRAFLHFDLLRLFAPAEDDGQEYLPYCDVYPAIFQQREKVNGFLDKAIADLLEAKRLLATFDTVSDVRLSQLSTTNRLLGSAGIIEDAFYCFRGFRMNYYAVTAMLARVYSYKKEYHLAYEQAQEVIDKELFPVRGDYGKPKQYEDVIFALSNRKLTELFQVYHTGDRKVLCIPVAKINEIAGADTYDYRLAYHLQNQGSGYKLSKKYLPVNAGKEDVVDEIIPIIRTSEMEYIVGEYYASVEDWTNAAQHITAVRQASYAYSPVAIASMEDYQKAWLNDAFRTFIGEGQLFYLYKKLNLKIREDMKAEDFVFPVPDSEDVTLN